MGTEGQAAQVEEVSMESVMAGEAAPVVAAPEQPAPIADQPAESAPAPVDTPAEPDGVQKRINKITADKYEQQRRAEAAEQRLASLEAQQPAAPAQSVAEPKVEDFETDEAYHAALIDHRLDVKLAAQATTVQQTRELERRNEVANDFNAKVATFTETTPDYVDTINQIPQLQPETLEAIMTMDNGPQVAHYLGKHLDVADEIATASPMAAAMRLGEIRSQLANPKPNAQPSAAPEPVETLYGGGSGGGKDLDGMSMEEIMAL